MSTPVPQPGGFRRLHDDVEKQGEWWDTGLSVTVSILAFFAVPVGAATWSPAVADAAGEGWIAVFFATLTWSLGCAIAMFAGQRGVAGWPLAGAAVLGFFASAFVASKLGEGFLDLTPAAASNPAHTLLGIVGIALQTYGFLGAIFGAGIGAWLGYLVSRHVT